MNKTLYVLGLLLFLSLEAFAQQVIKGTVKDASGKPVVGVRIHQIGAKNNNNVTDNQGDFTLPLEKGGYIELNYADILIKKVRVTDNVISIILDQNQDRVLDLGFVKRTVKDQTQSVSVISSDFLAKNATSTDEFANALYGLIPGIHMTQAIGWGATATMNIRGKGNLGSGAPLLLIDGFERSLGNLTLEDVESVQVLKDGAATALWGAKAANGVLLVKTKQGIYNTFKVDVNYRRGFDFAINKPKMVDAYTYALAKNEALQYDRLPLQYSNSDLEQFRNNANSDIYPNVNWLNEGLRNFGERNEFNLMLRGGGKRMRYMTMLDYNNKFGLLSEKYTKYSDQYNSQIRSYDFSLRSNLDVDITSSTQLKFNLLGTLVENKYPNTDIDAYFKNLYAVPSAAFPVKTSKGNWGSNNIFKINPIASIADLGYIQDNRRILNADMRLSQDLSMLITGLSAEAAVSYDNSAVFKDVFSKSYLYEINTKSSNGTISSQTFGTNTVLQLSSSGLDDQFIRSTLEGKLNYDRTFSNHQITASGIYRQQMYQPFGVNSSSFNKSFIGLLSYNYADKYMVDVVGNYFGSSVLLKGDKFRFYPAVSAGWNLANEAFLKDINAFDLFKVRASWGRSALDKYEHGLGNSFWISGGSYPFGASMTSSSGLKEKNLPLKTLDLETSDKYNLGVDLCLWKNLTFTAEVYSDFRSNILLANNNVSGILGATVGQSNVGKVSSHGLEMSLGWKHQRKELNYYVNANIAFNDSRVIENGEAFQPYDYMSAKGYKVGQLFGYEAIGYFRDDADIANSPEQMFSTVLPGDVKYKDLNNDQKIDYRDRKAIGKSTIVPDMVFGFNLGLEYKGFGIGMVFNGASGISKLLNIPSVHQPLRELNNNVSYWYMYDKVRWTEQTKDVANVPRLSTLSNSNNYQTSTQWLADGSFIKLRSTNVYYNLPKNWVKVLKLENIQLYARAENLFSIDKIENFNCEDLQLGYPDVSSVAFGLNVNF